MKKILALSILLMGSIIAASGQTYTTVSTFAGTGTSGLVNGPVATARFNFNYGICSDSAGNIYVADAFNHCIRKISNGVVSTVAGNGFAGDVDGVGSSARFNTPIGVYFKNGYLYICDNSNHKIKRMDMSLNVVTIAGSGSAGYVDGAALSARFYEPKSLVVDNANNVYVADYENHCIRKIANGTVSTYAGIGTSPGDVLGASASARFNRPRDLCIDVAGNLYVADLTNHKVKVISTGGTVSLVAGSGASSSIDGTGAGASFNLPVGIDWGTSGDLFVLDAGTGKVRRLTTAGVVTTVAGSGNTGFINGPVASARFGTVPQDICLDPAGNLYIGDRTNNVIRVLTNVNSLNASTTSTSITCNGGNDGTATITASGGTSPYTYLWSPAGGTNATATNLSAGTYSCVVTDAVGANYQQTVTITAPAQVSVVFNTTPVACNNQGSATAIPSGGTSPFTYSWSSGGTSATENNLAVGNYTCTITDANGCNIVQTVSITQLAPLTASIVSTGIFCYGNTASATVAVSGGDPGYTFNWSPSGGTGQTATGLPAGNYTCTITDNSGCVNQQSVVITQPQQLASSAVANNLSCYGDQNGSAFVATTGGTPAYSFSWSSGGTTSVENGLAAGTYTVTVTDANSCISTSSVVITSPLQVTSDVTQTALSCFGDCDAVAATNTTGGTGSYSYNWSPSGCTTSSCANLCAGSYSVIVTDSLGCNGTATFVITQPSQLISSVSHTNETLQVGNDGTATASPSGGNPGYTYLWMPGNQTTATATGLDAGTYTCTITDANNCTITVTVTVNTMEDVGIQTNANLDFSVTLFPNPAQDYIVVSIESTQKQDMILEIYNVLGEKIDAIDLGNSNSIKYSYNTSSLANGTYFVCITSGTTVAKQKFTVVH